MLRGQNLGKFALFGVEQFAETKEDRLTTSNRGVAPFGERRMSTCNRLLDVGLVGKDNAFSLFAECRVVDRCGAVGCSVVACSVDPVRDSVFVPMIPFSPMR